MNAARLRWDVEGLQWPHRAHSRMVRADGLQWHVQVFGANSPRPAVLLLHGTGASTHSWRGVAPLLAATHDVIVPDLPGHAFTGMPDGGTASAQLSLPGMARALAALLHALGCAPGQAGAPAMIVGHSAGAAVALRMVLDGLATPGVLVSINGALLPLGGWAGQLFLPAARLLAAVPLVPRVFARRAADPAVLRRLLDGTGSTLDEQGTALYGTLVANAGHAAGALGMMANWDLHTLAGDLPRLRTPLALVVGTRDRTVPPAHARRVHALLPPAARLPLRELPGLGHLAHEEQPELACRLIRECMSRESMSPEHHPA